MELDQFMKELIVEFLVEVVRLFFPSLAQRLDFAQKKDLNKQLYTGSPQGAERFVDVLLEVRVKEPPPDSILLHIESQQQKRFDFPARMLAYRTLIYVREIEAERRDSFTLSELTAWQNQKQVWPFVFCNYPLEKGITVERHGTGLPNARLTCEYTCISLPMLSAQEYLKKDNVVVCALATLMNPEGFSKPELKVACYRKLIPYLTNLTRRQIDIIVYAIETYLNLTDKEEQIYQQLIQEILPEVSQMIINPLVERGRQEGIRQGLQRGRQQGRQQGRQTREKEIALSMLQKGFSQSVIAEVTGLRPLKIEALKSEESMLDNS